VPPRFISRASTLYDLHELTILRIARFATRSDKLKIMPEAEIVLFGDSLTEWGFFESTSGYGWALERAYSGKAKVRNEGDSR